GGVMPLHTRSIKAPKKDDDGVRISVMSRHTLADGITLDPEILDSSYDEWWVTLAPLPHLVGDYYKRGLSWEEFEKKFNKYLEKPYVRNLLYRLIEQARNGDVTILCAEDTPEHCHRRLIAEACRRINPHLEISIT
ncbi:MAG: DUF488 domain-containing protein, partial [Candidatus Azambacteria bacterium]|nr:DUF488 domain-containing protein [Candidatus Azambacteria bacterium]